MIKPGLRARDIDSVIEEILDLVQRNIDRYMFYFYGWGGYGVTALLCYMARVLLSMKGPPPGLPFDRIIYLDCSMWKSKREMQRRIAEELKLNHNTMAMFAEQDEEDDFNGVDIASRDVIPEIAAVINRTMRESRFMLIFINGSHQEITLIPFGIPEYHDSVIIWTYRGGHLENFPSRFSWLRPRRKIRSNSTVLHSLWRLSDLTTSNLTALLHEEFALINKNEEASALACLGEMDLKMVVDGFLYSLFISGAIASGYLSKAKDSSSYWICDGVIHGDKAGEISNALHQKLEEDGRAIASILSSRKSTTPYLIGTDDDVLGACGERPYRWIAITLKDEIASKNKKVQEDMQTALATASSIMLRSETWRKRCALLDVLFKHCNNVSVLILAYCSFSFVSPPFQHCHKLRLLELDQCTDDNTTQPEEEGDTMQRPKWICLHGLQVLRLHYTEWGEILSEEWSLPLMANLEELKVEGVWCWQFICQLERRLPNLKRLRIIWPVHQAEPSTDISNSLIDKTKLEVLDLSGNNCMKNLPASLSKASRLQELVVDGCAGLENVMLANSSLKSFSLRYSIELEPAVKTSKISLKGCTQLEKLMLPDPCRIVELDLSGCAIKVLDLEAMNLRYVERLFLLGCGHLYRIIPCYRREPSTDSKLKFVCIDTRLGKVVRPSSVELQPRGSDTMQIHAIIADARFARSLLDLAYMEYSPYLYINITSSAAYGWPLQPEATRKELTEYKDQQNCIVVQDLYGDVFKDELGDGPLIPRQAFQQPPCVQLDRHIEIGDGSRKVQSEVEANDRSLGGLMRKQAESLHVHDTKARAATPTRNWSKLRWCRVERCPNLDVVFPSFRFNRRQSAGDHLGIGSPQGPLHLVQGSW